MPPLPGEERTLTVFADIHYYFSTPTPKPLHHRFDKGSYFYVYHNEEERSSRLEIANHPGTKEQDAFNGYLDNVHLTYSYKFPTLLTLAVDPKDPSSAHASSPESGRDPQEWRLASADPRDEGKYMYRLHTLDIYFWTLEDSKLVMDTFRQLLHYSQLDIMDAPQEEDTSHLVQNLENVAISDPEYTNGRTRNSRNQPSYAQQHDQHGAASVSPGSTSQPAHSERASSAQPEQKSAGFAPMPYNPAAPPAPEPIAHREDTPPPPDAHGGTGLTAAALADHAPPQYAPQVQPYTGVPGAVPSATGHYGSPPPQATSAYGSPPPGGLSHTPSVSSASTRHGSIASPYAPTPATATSASSGQHIHATSAYVPASSRDSDIHRASVTGAPSFAPPPQDPNTKPYGSTNSTPLASPGVQFYGSGPPSGPKQPLQHIQPQYPDYLSSKVSPPPGGFSNYSYDQPQLQRPQSGTSPYDVHSQVYRPTEAEVAPKKSSRKPSQSGQQPYDGSYQQGKIGEKADKVEKGVNRFLKKLEKKVG